MSETKNPGDKTISMERKTLGLKRPGVEQGTVRQSFSHGRTKAVVVEKKKRRVVLPGEGGKPEAEAEAAPRSVAPPPQRRPASEPAPPARRSGTSGPQRPRGGTILRTLTEDEAAARQQALIEAQRRDAEDRKRREEEERLRAIEEERRKVEEAERARQEAEEAARRAAEEAERKKSDDGREKVSASDAADAISAAVGEVSADAPAPAARDEAAR